MIVQNSRKGWKIPLLYAVDKHKNRIFADCALSEEKYYCPKCFAPLSVETDSNNQKYFSHNKAVCSSDTWTNKYTSSAWQRSIILTFPEENREKYIKYGNESHCADILIGTTAVILNQNLPDSDTFLKKSKFFNECGYNTVWLINLSKLYNEGKITLDNKDDFQHFIFHSKDETFLDFNTQFCNIDLFLKLKSEDTHSIVRVYSFSSNNSFTSSDFISFSDFQSYVGINCQYKESEYDSDYDEFKEEYNLHLNIQQERAVKRIHGANLLLAVPGSGKTTVLINRIGYMILKKHIDPYNILAITYNVAASEDMKKRFSCLFGDKTQLAPQFRTINSIALEIYKVYCKKRNFRERTMLKENERTCILRQIYINVSKNYLVSENDISFLSSHFTYIKNMELSENEISQFNQDMPKFDEMFSAYKSYLKSHYKMDFDDQLLFAHWVLQNNSDILNMYRKRYQYICVDEAQDTSKIQHKIIYLLAHGSNIFMVGDEDQSIYGFRAAYPQALLSFRLHYPNAYIQKMEYNYRSVPQITQIASSFIEKNSDRYKKNLTPVRNEKGEVKRIEVDSREKQYEVLLEKAKLRKDKTAFLYRDNASAVVLADILLNENIPFISKRSDFNFFKTRTVMDIIAYLELFTDPHNVDAFNRICNTGILFIKNAVKSNVISIMKRDKITYSEAIYKLFPSLPENIRRSLSKGIASIKEISLYETPKEIICQIRASGYNSFMKSKGINKNSVDILEILAGKTQTVNDFFKELNLVENALQNGNTPIDNPIVLSTIHSSKGLEYDTVYMVDVFDGVFPLCLPDTESKNTSCENELEERRIFYVGITRAKNNLYFFSVRDSESTYIDEIFPQENSQKSSSQTKINRLMAQNQKIIDARCYNEVRNKLKKINCKTISDSLGRTWAKCDICGKIKLSKYFYEYDSCGRNVCFSCYKLGL